MKAMIMERVVSLLEDNAPLRLVDIPMPVPGPGEVLLEIAACGVCHTEIDEIEGRTPPPRLPIVPGHEVIGRVVALSHGETRLNMGDRVGVGWIHESSGAADENLSPHFVATGRDVNGGYAEYMTVPAGYAYHVPEGFSDIEAAPLMCAGAIGYRALELSGLKDGGALGLSGFGGSAHLVLQLALHLYPSTKVYVFARDDGARDLARSLGAAWVGDITDRAPVALNAVIDTTPAWKPIIEALKNLRPGGRLVINAIRKEGTDQEELLKLSYHEHLWMEREIKTVANITHFDIAAFLIIAAEIPIRPVVETYALRDANKALFELKTKPIQGSKVLVL